VTVHGWAVDEFRAKDDNRYQWQDGKWKLRETAEPAH
jgi:hypothetical protein